MLSLLKKCGSLYQGPFTLVAVDKDNQPLIFVNQAFRDLTGYQDNEILGRNCRFLQGELSDKKTTLRIRNAISSRMPTCEDLLNYRKDGSTFWNRLVLLPIEINGEHFYFGLQHDVTQKVLKPALHSLDVDAEAVADKIKNKLNAIILQLNLNDKTPNDRFVKNSVELLNKVSEYVYSL